MAVSANIRSRRDAIGGWVKLYFGENVLVTQEVFVKSILNVGKAPVDV